MLHEVLLADTPSESHSWEEAPTVAGSELAWTVGTERSCQEILVGVCIVYTSEEWSHIVLCTNSIGSRLCFTGTLMGKNLSECEVWWEVDYRNIVILLQRTWPLLTNEYIQTVTLGECILCVVCQGICVTPVAYVYTWESWLWSTCSCIVVTCSELVPSLVCILVSPSITELRTESKVLEWFPVQACVVVLTETTLLLVGTGHTVVRIDIRIWRLVSIIIAWSVQRLNRTVCDCLVDDRVGSARIVGVTTWVQTVDYRICQTGIKVKWQPFVQLCVQLGVDVVLRKVRTHHDALVIGTRVANIKLCFLWTATYREVVDLLQTCASEQFILPVVSCNRLPDVHVSPVAILLVFAILSLILILGVVVWRKYFNLLHHLADTERSSEVNLYLSFLTTLCRNDNNTIGTTRTIDSGWRSVLQYVDALYVVRSDVANRRYRETVYNIKRWVVLWKRTSSTHTDLDLCVRWTFCCGYCHTSHLTLNSLWSRRNRNVGKVLCRNRSNGTCQVFLLYSTVTDNHDIVQCSSLVFHYNVNTTLSTDIYSCCLHTDVWYRNLLAAGKANGEVTVKVSNCHVLGTLLLNGSTDDWFTVAILHISF